MSAGPLKSRGPFPPSAYSAQFNCQPRLRPRVGVRGGGGGGRGWGWRKEGSEGLTCQALPGNLELGFQTCSLGASLQSSLRAGPAGAMPGKGDGFGRRRLIARLRSGPFRRNQKDAFFLGRIARCPRAERSRIRKLGGMAGAVHVDTPSLTL